MTPIHSAHLAVRADFLLDTLELWVDTRAGAIACKLLGLDTTVNLQQADEARALVRRRLVELLEILG
jgi:hypothetical protein